MTAPPSPPPARARLARSGARAVIVSVLLSACGEEARAAPPPLPEVPAVPSAPERERANTTAARESAAGAARELVAFERAPAPKKAKRKTTGAAYVPPPEPAPAPAQTAIRGPSAVVIAPVAAKPKARVSIPRTDHVHAEIPSGLQADLDADPRMQPWVEKVIAIADACHARARGNTGTIEAQLTMHENERPNADVRSLPAQLGGLVACATGSLMRTKMPLFTGREGTRYTVRIVFE